jgi:hypothetical protein
VGNPQLQLLLEEMGNPQLLENYYVGVIHSQLQGNPTSNCFQKLNGIIIDDKNRHKPNGSMFKLL